jgi:hypothetical protein
LVSGIWLQVRGLWIALASRAAEINNFLRAPSTPTLQICVFIKAFYRYRVPGNFQFKDHEQLKPHHDWHKLQGLRVSSKLTAATSASVSKGKQWGRALAFGSSHILINLNIITILYFLSISYWVCAFYILRINLRKHNEQPDQLHPQQHNMAYINQRHSILLRDTKPPALPHHERNVPQPPFMPLMIPPKSNTQKTKIEEEGKVLCCMNKLHIIEALG